MTNHQRFVVTIAFVAALSGCAKSRPAVTPSPPPVDPVQQIRDAITATTRRPGVEHGVWGIVVHSLDRDERLYALNADTLLVPASVAKLVTVATAAEARGWDYRFETTLGLSGAILDVLGAGPDDLGILKGDLLVTGSGDPTIGGRGGEDLGAWIDALKAHGIRRVDGRVIGDDDNIEEPRPALAWAWDDLGYATGALFGALNLAENRMTVTVEPGRTAGEAALLGTDSFATARLLINRVVTGDPSSPRLLWPEQRPGERALSIAGSIPAGATPARLSVSAGNPTFWFASVLRARLIEAGIPVLDTAYDVDDLDGPIDRSAFTTVHVHRSPPLRDIVQPLLKDSINLYAEAVMRLNASGSAVPTNDAALEGLRQRLASWGIPAAGQQLVDGSGLSRRNVITAESLMAVLRRMYDADASSPWMTALPVAGIDGSLASRMRGTAAEGNLRAKTGTMSNVRSLAGYLRTRDGERLAFAIMVNNFEGAGAAATDAVDAMAVHLASFSRRPITLP